MNNTPLKRGDKVRIVKGNSKGRIAVVSSTKPSYAADSFFVRLIPDNFPIFLPNASYVEKYIDLPPDVREIIGDLTNL